MSFLKWLFGKKKPSIEPVDGESFVEYIDRQGFKHFRGKELTGYFQKWRGDVQNSYPPRAMWPNFVPTLRVVDDIRRVGVVGNALLDIVSRIAVDDVKAIGKYRLEAIAQSSPFNGIFDEGVNDR